MPDPNIYHSSRPTSVLGFAAAIAAKEPARSDRGVGLSRPMNRIRFTLAISVLALGFAVPAGLSQARAETIAFEQEVMALFVYNFAGFIAWPPRPVTNPSTTPLVIAVGGQPDFVGTPTRVIGVRKVRDRRVLVRAQGEDNSIADEDVLFAGRNDYEGSGVRRANVSSHAALTIGEADGFRQRVRIVNFYLNDARLFFEFNPAAADRTGLKASSRLLRLARIVKEPG